MNMGPVRCLADSYRLIEYLKSRLLDVDLSDLEEPAPVPVLALQLASFHKEAISK